MPGPERPLPLENWKPKSTYHLVDLGCATPARLAKIFVRHSGKNLLGVDPALAKGAMTSGEMELVGAKAEDVIPLLLDGSVHVFNADYLLNNLSREETLRLLALLKAKMRPSGRLYISHRNEAGSNLREIVSAAGFLPSKPESIEGKNLHMSAFAQNDKETRDNLRRFREGDAVMLPSWIRATGALGKYLENPDAFTPMRFVARLRK